MAIKLPQLEKITAKTAPTAEQFNRLQLKLDDLVRAMYRLSPTMEAQQVDVVLDPNGTGASTPVDHNLGRTAKWWIGNQSKPCTVYNDAKNPLPNKQVLLKLSGTTTGPISCTVWVS